MKKHNKLMKALPELRPMQAATRVEREQGDANISAGHPVPPIPSRVNQAPDQDDQDARAGETR
jgi:hypothetical protein